MFLETRACILYVIHVRVCGTGEALPTGRWGVTRAGSVKRLIINDQMLAAVVEPKGSTDAINSAQWSSGLLLGTCCSCHRARLIIPSTPSHPPSSLQPAAAMRLLSLPATSPHITLPTPTALPSLSLFRPFLGSAMTLRAKKQRG